MKHKYECVPMGMYDDHYRCRCSNCGKMITVSMDNPETQLSKQPLNCCVGSFWVCLNGTDLHVFFEVGASFTGGVNITKVLVDEAGDILPRLSEANYDDLMCECIEYVQKD